MEEILSNLNEVQRQAVLYNEGPSLVVAGAGSGKTRVLTYKIAALIKQGLRPSSILALTFTNKAAREMKERIAQIVGSETANKLWMGTFHSIFYRILRMEADTLGFDSNFTIYDSADSANLIRTIIKELKLDDKTYKPSKVHARISQLKNNLITPQIYVEKAEYHEVDMKAKMPLLKDIYVRYTNRCKKACAMDFDDLLLYTNILFRDHPGILTKYQNVFKFILVDEYQDTNSAQHRIVRKLAEKHHKVCVVGDDAQSIYSFRGADIENILQFKTEYKECKIFKLEQNYRSTKNIVSAANSLIQKNKNQLEKNVFSTNEDGTRVRVISTYSDLDESMYVSRAVLDHIKMGYNYCDIAILYRTNSQSRALEDSLRKKNIPYKIYGGLSFYQRKEIKDVLAYIKFTLNNNDEEALKRIINYPTRGIGDTTVSKLSEAANTHRTTHWEVLSNPLKFNLAINSGTANKLLAFRDLIEDFRNNIAEKDAYNMADYIVKKSGVWADLCSETTPEAMTKQQNVEELLKGIHEFCQIKQEESGEENVSLADFLHEVSLLTDQDTESGDDNNKITLMTVHASKGLEFKNVFIVGMEEELFPSNMSSGSEAGIEEERRLFYVALTRAEQNCIITYAKSRFRNGSSNFCNPSRFIRDIDAALLDLPDDYIKIHSKKLNQEKMLQNHSNRVNTRISNSNFGKYSSRQEQAPSPQRSNLRSMEELNRQRPAQPTVATGNLNVKVGATVEHETFGKGRIADIENHAGSIKVTIKFENAGIKKILLKYAKMKILG